MSRFNINKIRKYFKTKRINHLIRSKLKLKSKKEINDFNNLMKTWDYTDYGDFTLPFEIQMGTNITCSPLDFGSICTPPSEFIPTFLPYQPTFEEATKTLIEAIMDSPFEDLKTELKNILLRFH